MPSLERAQWLSVSELSLAVVLLLFAESYGAIRGMALKHGDVIELAGTQMQFVQT